MSSDVLPQLTPKDCERILRSIDEHRCVLVIGPHFRWRDGEKTDAEVLAGKLLQTLDQQSDIDTSDLNPSVIAERYLSANPRERYRLNELVVEHYESIDSGLSDAAQWLMVQSFPVVISITPDPALLAHFIQNKQESQIAWTGEGSPQRLIEPSTDNPVFYSLFGRAESPFEDTLVLTTEDRLKLIRSLVSGEGSLPAALEQALRDPSRVYLFVGFGFEQWFARMLLHTLLGEERVANTLRPSFAFESNQFLQHSDAHATVLFFKDRHLVEFRPGDMGLLRSPTFKNARSNVTVSANANQSLQPPQVFLSYRREDEARVDKIRDVLESSGIHCWQDTENLRGGEQWLEVIRREVGQRADFFVLVQSEALAGAKQSVVFEELEFARQRDKRRNPERAGSFIVPIEIDSDAHLQNTLGNLHCLDLTHASKYAALAEDIFSRWDSEKPRG